MGDQTLSPDSEMLPDSATEDPAVIERILSHLKGIESTAELAMSPGGMAPPQARLFDWLHDTPII